MEVNKYESFKDKLDTITESGDVCVIDSGYGLQIGIYSHKAGKTYVFEGIVKGMIPNIKSDGYHRRVQHNQVSLKVINLSKLPTVKTIEK